MYCLLPLHEVLFDLECSDSCNNDSKVIGKKKEKEEIKTKRKREHHNKQSRKRSGLKR